MASERKKTLREILEKIVSGDDVTQLKDLFRNKLGLINPLEVGFYRDEWKGEGIPEEKIQILIDMSMEIFRFAIQNHKPIVSDGHPIYTLMMEHAMLMEYVNELHTLVQALSSGERETKPEFLDRVRQIIGFFKESESHYLREENALFPGIEKKGLTGPPAAMWSEHQEIHALEKKLFSLDSESNEKLTKNIENMSELTLELANFLASHFNKENTILFPASIRLFNERDWGLIIYDEVHLLPAPVFRITAEIQARRRLGLTATLVREDGQEEDVFALIGPKKYDVPWKDLERQGWIATAECHEVRIPLPEEQRMIYALADSREKITVAAYNPDKLPVLRILLDKHREDSVLIIGTYLKQLQEIARAIDAPLITGKTAIRQREKLFAQLRSGEIAVLVISKVGNFSIDLPDVTVAIQVSGSFGSRQEEAQRLGRILRPKRHGLLAHFYTLVSRDTREQEFAAKRQLFLTEQGYRYEILYDDELVDYEPTLLALRAEERLPYLTASVG